MSNMEFVVLLPVVRSKEGLHVTPGTLDGICVIPGVRIDEGDRVICSSVRVTVRLDILIRNPAISVERSVGFNKSMDNVRQCVDGSFRNGKKKCSTGLAFHTAAHPLALYRVSPMAFPLTELTLIDLNSLLRTADLLKATLQLYQQCLSAEHTPLRNRVIRKVVYALDLVGRFAAQDVVREVQFLLEDEMTPLEP